MKLPLKLTGQHADKYANVRDDHGLMIAPGLTHDDAAQIVTACNAHDQLVAALQNALGVLQAFSTQSQTAKTCADIASEALTAAGAPC